MNLGSTRLKSAEVGGKEVSRWLGKTGTGEACLDSEDAAFWIVGIGKKIVGKRIMSGQTQILEKSRIVVEGKSGGVDGGS